ncbi:hypothetical protein HZH66_001864 [Vespula vulgaris]|uniref:Uncharacterized protein n=1 Tax=Vespula vulgaris TaxID=7454 RepID=A0A834NFE2_VESVU|nr:hypothetical protein HZH66_001864 [Vespula vulgaris]
MSLIEIRRTIVYVLIFGFLLLLPIKCQTPMSLLIVIENEDSSILSVLNDAASSAEKDFGHDLITVHLSKVEVDRENLDESFQKVCAVLYKGVSLILDMTWSGWDLLRIVAEDKGIVYKRGDCSINPYVQAVDDLLLMKNATDVGLIFEDERELNQSLYYLIGISIIRLVVIDEFTDRTVSKIRSMRPSPSYYAIYSSTYKMEEYVKTAIEGGLVKRDDIWNLIFTDNRYKDFKYISVDSFNVSCTVLTMNSDVCCHLMGESNCNCPADFQIFPICFKRLIGLIVSIMNEIQKSGISVEPKSGQCPSNLTGIPAPSTSNETAEAFNKFLISRLTNNDTFDYWSEKATIMYKAEISLQTLERGFLKPLGTWTRRNKIVEASGSKIRPAKRFFRIGTTKSIPWSMPKIDPATGQTMRDADGNEVWEGYCIDFIEKLSEEMQFDYELVIPIDRSFGEKLQNGQWSGLVGDLAKGETDIAVAALTMTSEREEVIDFVAPYFEQSGILIVMRKPVRKASLFKFMTVLRPEVWLSIVGALTLTGIMIWILDKYSPYSARNNKRLYPYPCREFTLKESFWFALTSFTPQGGGEAPKALSSRTLVAAYWLFVVLMLATFTANLAAFLTVERMQSPVQSLEQLARQSRINYTVRVNSGAHQYFINMKNAEDKLYTAWKEITLNSTSDQIEYRVWDYPIKEQYGHILQAITQVGPVESNEEGFRKVIESENAEFAFIHDSSQIKYEVTRNCNLTEVGEVFAEQPYAIAVQQGSHLQEEISRRILDLQKDRYFETLASKYWNQSLKAQCPNSDDSEGITLESLGGVFIATLFGLALAMITLAGEVLYYRKRNASQGKDKKKDSKVMKKMENDEKLMIQKLASKLQMKPAPTDGFFSRQQLGQPRIYFLMVLSVSCVISLNQKYEEGSKETNLNNESKRNPWYHVKTDPINSERSDLIFIKKIPREDKNVKKILSPPFKTLPEKDNTSGKKENTSERSNIRNRRSNTLKITVPKLFSTLEDRGGSKMAVASTATVATAAAAEQHVADRNDPFGRNKNPYRFGDEIFTADETADISEKYKNKDENCEKIIRDSMVCMLCKDIKSKAKYEQCSYVSQPNEKSYAYTKSRSFGKARDENEKNDDNNGGRSAENRKIVPVEEKHYEPSYPSERYEGSRVKASNDDETGIERYGKKKKEKEGEEEREEKEEGYDDEEEKGSSSTDCKKIERDGKTCTVCKDPKTGGNYEKCSYAYQPMDKIYKFSRSKSFGYPENLSKGIKKVEVSTIENYPRESRYTDYSKDYTLPFEESKKNNFEKKSIPSKVENESYDSYIPDHYKSPSEYKSESEKNSERIDRSNCKVIEKDSMTCKVCKDPKTGDNFEQCSYSYKPKDKVYAYSKGKSFGSPTKSENDDEKNESSDIYDVQENVKETKVQRPYDKLYDKIYDKVYDKNDDYDDKRVLDSSGNSKSLVYAPTSNVGRDDSSIDVIAGKKLINEGDGYFDDSKRKKEEIERFLKEFQKEDRSNCKKVMKDNMTCYRCKDDKDIRKEECMFVGDQDVKENNNDRLTYREVKQFKLPDIKSSGSSLNKRNSNDKIIVDSDILEPIASASEDSYARTVTSDDDVEKTTEEEQLHEVEPYEYVAETRPIYDKKLGLILPAFMLTKSEHEREFDDMVASSRI